MNNYYVDIRIWDPCVEGIFKEYQHTVTAFTAADAKVQAEIDFIHNDRNKILSIKPVPDNNDFTCEGCENFEKIKSELMERVDNCLKELDENTQET